MFFFHFIATAFENIRRTPRAQLPDAKALWRDVHAYHWAIASYPHIILKNATKKIKNEKNSLTSTPPEGGHKMPSTFLHDHKVTRTPPSDLSPTRPHPLPDSRHLHHNVLTRTPLYNLLSPQTSPVRIEPRDPDPGPVGTLMDPLLAGTVPHGKHGATDAPRFLFETTITPRSPANDAYVRMVRAFQNADGILERPRVRNVLVRDWSVLNVAACCRFCDVIDAKCAPFCEGVMFALSAEKNLLEVEAQEEVWLED